jgi:Gram-negative bacterial TonB protein C-terminal
VVFACVLDESGHLQNLRVVSGSSASPSLEEAVRRWIFHPALSGSQPVAVDALIGIGIGVQ